MYIKNTLIQLIQLKLFMNRVVSHIYNIYTIRYFKNAGKVIRKVKYLKFTRVGDNNILFLFEFALEKIYQH